MNKEEKTITLGNELYEEFIEGKQTIDTHELLCLFAKRINNLQSKIDKANELLEEILVVSDWEHEGRFRPVKGTTAQDVYKIIVKLNELLETPRRINYELLKEDK